MAKRRWKIEDIKSVVTGENPFKQFGYSVPEPVRKPGDRWTDAQGKTWEQRNGYRTIVNEKADAIRDLSRQTCSKCNMDIRWGNRLDKHFFPKSGMCYDCTLINDTMLMANGQWKDYERKKTMSNHLAFLKDVLKYVEESITYLSTTDGKMRFVDEMGGIETWTNTQIDTLLEVAKDDREKLLRDIKEMEAMLADMDKPKEINAQ